MRTIEIDQDGEAVVVHVIASGKPVSEHVIHAVGPNGSLAHFRGGPGVADDAPPATRADQAKSASPD